MLSQKVIDQAVERIVRAAQPNEVILFGSYALGDFQADSDLDLMVILPGQPDKVAEMIRLRQTVGAVGTGVDVLVFSEEEAQRRVQVPGTVVYWANREGKVLYEAAAIPPGRHPESLPMPEGSVPNDWRDAVYG